MTTMLIAGGRVLSDGGPQGAFADVLVEDGTIAAVTAAGAVTDANVERVDARGKLIIPGLVNAHTHAHGNLAKGSGDRWTLEMLLTHAMRTRPSAACGRASSCRFRYRGRPRS